MNSFLVELSSLLLVVMNLWIIHNFVFSRLAITAVSLEKLSLLPLPLYSGMKAIASRDITGWHKGKAFDSYSGGVIFESRPGHRLFFRGFPQPLQINARIVSLLCQYCFPIRHFIHRPTIICVLTL